MAEKKIVLGIGGVDYAFQVTSDNFNRYINEIRPDDKVLPAKRFLRRSLVAQEQRESLDDLCDRGFALNIVGEVVQEFQGEIEIEVKK